eukprot:TRINITY_DN54555_c0_g1_i1.p1 TRINITY_DN54555_c0_g1~~TRINITY_DN54555_c0_g1_i1.p1  ORF type:complete len:455 (+),score=43.22 TRINITY_DN54555_c0_g1_i1:51-1367(+)
MPDSTVTSASTTPPKVSRRYIQRRSCTAAAGIDDVASRVEMATTVLGVPRRPVPGFWCWMLCVAAFSSVCDSTGWTMEAYKDSKCEKRQTRAGAQVTWTPVVGSPQCFKITSGIDCSTFCTVKPICARGSNSGVKLAHYSGNNCIGDWERVTNFNNHLTWPELEGFLKGNCTLRDKKNSIWERYVSRTWDVGTDFPNCFGYDYSTQGSGLITADPKDSPMKLSLYTDDTCATAFALPPGGVANKTTTGKPEWTQQTWMSVIRTIDVSQRKQHHEHCWTINKNRPSTMKGSGAIKFKCQQMVDGRMGMDVLFYDDVECAGKIVTEEVFFTTLLYVSLRSGQSDVEDLVGWFDGKCMQHSQDLWWKWDRAVFVEDWPNCYSKALQENIMIRRPNLQDIHYKGPVKAVRRPQLGGTRPSAVPSVFATVFLVIASTSGRSSC